MGMVAALIPARKGRPDNFISRSLGDACSWLACRQSVEQSSTHTIFRRVVMTQKPHPADEGVSIDGQPTPENVASLEESLDKLSNPDLTMLYLQSKRAFRDQCKRVERVSRGSGGVLATENHIFWASVLFTRISVTAKSIEKLLPDTKAGELWDFSAVASLARNLSEIYLFYYWLCEDDVIDVVRQARSILLYLHDRGSRRKMFGNTDNDDIHVYEDLVQRFDANVYLSGLSEKKRNEALRGEKRPFVQDDVLDRIGMSKEHFRTMYRFFSEHTHTGPVAFFRIADHGRGTGVETRLEKIYILITLGFASGILDRAIAGHLKLFPDAEQRPPYLTDRKIARNVAREQGRSH